MFFVQSGTVEILCAFEGGELRLDATITYDIDSKAAMLRWRVASAEWAGLIVADSPEKLFVHGPEGELLELQGRLFPGLHLAQFTA